MKSIRRTNNFTVERTISCIFVSFRGASDLYLLKHCKEEPRVGLLWSSTKIEDWGTGGKEEDVAVCRYEWLFSSRSDGGSFWVETVVSLPIGFLPEAVPCSGQLLSSSLLPLSKRSPLSLSTPKMPTTNVYVLSYDAQCCFSFLSSICYRLLSYLNPTTDSSTNI